MDKHFFYLTFRGTGRVYSDQEAQKKQLFTNFTVLLKTHSTCYKFNDFK
jgi:hypothetical protein